MNIATHNHDGTIHLVAMWYGFTADGRPAFETFAKSQKVQNLERDNRDHRPRRGRRGLRGAAGASSWSAPPRSPRTPSVLLPIATQRRRALHGERQPESDREAVATMMARNRAADRDQRRQGVVSWDHTKLGGTY